MSDDKIHEMYRNMQHDRLKRDQALQRMTSRDFQSRVKNLPRTNAASPRSRSFQVGEGFVTVADGERKLLAQLTIPSQYSGVVTGLVQMFPESDTQPGVVNSITWQLRVNGMPVQYFDDFIGEFSKPYAPLSVHIPLVGSDTLGSISVSPGGRPTAQVPTVGLYAVNNFGSSVVLQAKLIGYTFAVAEIPDEFGTY